MSKKKRTWSIYLRIAADYAYVYTDGADSTLPHETLEQAREAWKAGERWQGLPPSFLLECKP